MRRETTDAYTAPSCIKINTVKSRSAVRLGASRATTAQGMTDEGCGVTCGECDAMGDAFISLSGVIGAGKTTLAREVGSRLNLPVYYEPVIDNVYLADFYRNMSKYAFALQVHLLNARFVQQQQIVWSKAGGVQDRSIYEDGVFAKMLCSEGLMDVRDYTTYVELAANMSNFMRKPNVIVHLDVSAEESMRRIKRRDRACEKDISLPYLEALCAAYETFISDISRSIPVIRVNWNSSDDFDGVARSIATEYRKISTVHHV